MGFLDLHDHVLWGIDDGCETPEETLEAARLLVALGWDELAPSPHAIPELPSRDPALCAARRAEAAELLAREGVPLRLHANAENKLDERFLERAGDPETRRGVGAGGWVLVEAPFSSSLPTLPDLVFRLRRKGVTPLFAHPERCLEFERPGLAAEVIRLGGAHQLNLGALAGVYGRNARRQAERFLDEGLYAAAATDLHHPGDDAHRWLERSLVALEKRAGPEGLRRLCAENPRRILRGEELP